MFKVLRILPINQELDRKNDWVWILKLLLVAIPSNFEIFTKILDKSEEDILYLVYIFLTELVSQEVAQLLNMSVSIILRLLIE